MRGFSALAASLVLLATLGAPSAGASTTAVPDPAGDGAAGERLDITRARLSNDEFAIKVKVKVAEVSRGRLVAYLQLRGHPGFYRAVTTYVPANSYVDARLFKGGGSEQLDCPVGASWDSGGGTRIMLRVPAPCLAGGRYDDVRFKVKTSRPPVADVAPTSDDGTWRWSTWTPR